MVLAAEDPHESNMSNDGTNSLPLTSQVPQVHEYISVFFGIVIRTRGSMLVPSTIRAVPGVTLQPCYSAVRELNTRCRADLGQRRASRVCCWSKITVARRSPGSGALR